MSLQSQEIYSTVTDEEKEMMQFVEEMLAKGEDMQTLFPNCIRRTSDGKWYEFLTNFDIQKLDHIYTVIRTLHAEEYLQLSRYAHNNRGEELEKCFSVWVPVQSTPKQIINDFFNLDRRLSLRYKELLIQCGIPEEELKWTAEIYLGCEKDRWPDKPWITDKILELIEDAKK